MEHLPFKPIDGIAASSAKPAENLDLPIAYPREETIWDCLEEDEAMLDEVMPALAQARREAGEGHRMEHERRLREAMTGDE